MKRYRIGLIALLTFAAAACDATMYRDSTTPIAGYGNAVQQNLSVMIVDPQPATAANTTLDFDGRRAGLAIERYREGKVIPPVELRTTDVAQ
ncbi:MAG TPA: hypothetical protein VFZ03_06980 [Dongiaceae bacterium]